jgi:hypothetical protein
MLQLRIRPGGRALHWWHRLLQFGDEGDINPRVGFFCCRSWALPLVSATDHCSLRDYKTLRSSCPLLLCLRIFQTRGVELRRSNLHLLLSTMLVLHPTSSCDICFETYSQKTQQARSLVATYSATGASTQVALVETRGVFAHPFSPASSHPQVYFCVSTKRVPIVSEEVLEFQCHETQNDRRWGWWSGSNYLQSGFHHVKHVEPSVRTMRLLEGKGLR